MTTKLKLGSGVGEGDAVNVGEGLGERVGDRVGDRVADGARVVDDCGVSVDGVVDGVHPETNKMDSTKIINKRFITIIGNLCELNGTQNDSTLQASIR